MPGPSRTVPDRLFAEARLAALYDLFCAERPDFNFYLPLVMAAKSALDVGCGTGELLHRARDAGHKGPLCGLDPAAGMLEQAQRRADVEWISGDLSSLPRDRAFDLIVMTGHAFQVLLEDDAIREAFAMIRDALDERGHFAFETRNPLVREWERWTADTPTEIVTPDGTRVRMIREIIVPFADEKLSFRHTFTSPGWERPEVSFSTLRFLGIDRLLSFLSDAGLAIEEQFGTWDRRPYSPASPEIITIAVKGSVR